MVVVFRLKDDAYTLVCASGSCLLVPIICVETIRICLMVHAQLLWEV